MVNVLLFLQSSFFFFVALFGYLILVIEIPFSVQRVPSYYLFIAEICIAIGYLFSSSLHKFFFLFKLSNLVQIYSLHPAILLMPVVIHPSLLQFLVLIPMLMSSLYRCNSLSQYNLTIVFFIPGIPCFWFLFYCFHC